MLLFERLLLYKGNDFGELVGALQSRFVLFKCLENRNQYQYFADH